MKINDILEYVIAILANYIELQSYVKVKIHFITIFNGFRFNLP